MPTDASNTDIPGDVALVTDEPVALPHPEGFTSRTLDLIAEHRWVVPTAIIAVLGISVAVRRARRP